MTVAAAIYEIAKKTKTFQISNKNTISKLDHKVRTQLYWIDHLVILHRGYCHQNKSGHVHSTFENSWASQESRYMIHIIVTKLFKVQCINFELKILNDVQTRLFFKKERNV